MLLTVYQRRALAVLALPLAGFDLAVLALALRQGWARQKLAGWWWVARHAGLVRLRRAAVQAARSVPDKDIAPLLTGSFSPGAETGFAAPRPLALVSAAWWWVASRLIR